ncbi:Glycoside hydrolase family 76 protein [Mycena sanguinolenta]|uniref:Glycoside hydrolase family 76 protein n=1 Tax=Mycena sanguinolenta TaxID=230812 RepID=A0A8H6X3V2_9AGAR|nr:Glycoside hydrolase family 76 protein [Mycena sanguinolenta]
MLLVVLVHALAVASQVASPSWNSTLTTSLSERVTLAGAALDVAVDRLSPDDLFDAEPFGITGNLYSQMADFDIATNQTKYESILEKSFQSVDTLGTNFSNPYVGPAKAYTAYNNTVFLQYAVQSWWFGRGRTISESDIAAGKIAGKNFTITTTCENVTMVGGTYWDDEPGEPSVAGISTGYFLVLSALLAEATPDPLYLQAANQSANFIRSHLYNAVGIVQQFMSTLANSTGCEVANNDLDPTDSGLMIEGLSILYSITKDTSTQNLLSDLIMAVIPNTAWQGQNGKNADMNLLQGLGAVYARNSVNTTLRQYVGDYIAVQFNAVTNLATSAGTNIYGSSWTGPPSDIFSGTNQTIALSALISAIGLETAASSSTTPAPSTSSTATPQSSSHHLGAILGGTFGALAFVAILAIAWWFMRRQPPRINAPNSVQPPRIPEVTPFIAAPSVITSSGSQITGFGSGDKRGEHQRPPPPPATVATQPRLSPSVNPGPSMVETNSDAASVLPTERLVQILNQRLQNRTWEEGEALPEYPVA